MAYERLDLKNGVVLDETHIKHLEDGICGAYDNTKEVADELGEDMANLGKNMGEAMVGKKIKPAASEIFNDYEGNQTNIPFAHIEGRNNKAIIKSYPIEVVGNNKVVITNYDGDTISVGDAWNIFYLNPDDGEVYKMRGFIEKFDETESGEWHVTLNGNSLESFIGRVSENTFFMSLFIKGGTIGSQEVPPEDVPTNYTIHMEGYNNVGYLNTHITGARNQALGYNSMAHGFKTEALGERASSKGYKTKASGNESDAKGQQTEASGYCASSKGSGTKATGTASSSEGSGTVASGNEAHAQNLNTIASGEASTSMGKGTKASGEASISGGTDSEASGKNSFALGDNTLAKGENATTLGKKTEASGGNSLAGGENSKAKDFNSFAFGDNAEANKSNSFSLGKDTIANGERSFATGDGTEAGSTAAFASGVGSKAMGKGSFASGNKTIANGTNCFTKGDLTEAYNESSSAEGLGTKAGSSYQHVQGKYNKVDWGSKYAHIVGNGTADNARSNAHTLDWNGNAWFAGDVTVGANGDKLATTFTASVEVPADGWYLDNNNGQQWYAQSIRCDGLLETDTPMVDVSIFGIIGNSAKLIMEAWSHVVCVYARDNTIILYTCDNIKPSTSFTMNIKVVR